MITSVQMSYDDLNEHQFVSIIWCKYETTFSSIIYVHTRRIYFVSDLKQFQWHRMK